jgi:hypothetical protein
VITVMIQFEINGPDGNPFPMWEKLIIDKLSSLPKGQGPPSPGRWTSHTKYLGREPSGNYVLRNFHLETFGPKRGGSLADPVGWFVDSVNWDAPFLILSNFDKTEGYATLYTIRDPDMAARRTKGAAHWFKAR